MNFHTKLECLLDKASKDCQGQCTSIVRKFTNYGCKKFYNIFTWCAPVHQLANHSLVLLSLSFSPFLFRPLPSSSLRSWCVCSVDASVWLMRLFGSGRCWWENPAEAVDSDLNLGWWGRNDAIHHDLVCFYTFWPDPLVGTSTGPLKSR